MTDDQHPDGPDVEPDDLDEEALRRAAEARDAARRSEAEALDERLSAFLDGELQLGEDRPDLDDPRLARRSGELSAVSDAVGARVPPLPPEVVDAQIARALEELTPAEDAPTSLTAARVAKRRGLAERLPVLGAAAAVVLVMFGFVALARTGDDEDSSGDTEAAEFSSREAGEADGADDGDSAIAAAEAAPEADETLQFTETESTEAPAEAEAEIEEAADDAAADAEEAADDGGADDAFEAAPLGEPIELTDECSTAVLASVGAEAIEEAIEFADGPAEVIVRFPDGSVSTALVDLGLCDAGERVEVDPVIELLDP